LWLKLALFAVSADAALLAVLKPRLPQVVSLLLMLWSQFFSSIALAESWQKEKKNVASGVSYLSFFPFSERVCFFLNLLLCPPRW
jgi:hypothetical protein